MQYTHPLSIQVEDGYPLGRQFFADVRLGRSRQNLRSFGGDVGEAAGERAQSNPRSPCHVLTLYVAAVPNADRGARVASEFGL
jgi:hypothetical protein